MAETNTKIKNRQEGTAACRFMNGTHAVWSRLRSMPVLFMLVAVWLVFILMSDAFLTVGNIITLFVMNAIFAIAATGETFVLMTGGIDLSIAHNVTCSSIISATTMITYQTGAVNRMLNPGGAVMSLSELAKVDAIGKDAVSAATASTLGMTILIGLAVALGVGLLIGAINGVSVGVFRMTPFIVTLATQLLARGTAMVVSGGYSIPGTPKELTRMSYATGIKFGDDLVIPWVIVILAGIVIVAGLLLGKTTWGRNIALVGANEQSARYVGINVRGVLVSVYIVAGLLAGVAGFVTMMSLGTADPKVGDPILITIIGSVILGGVDMNGGDGSMAKAALGMFLFATLVNGMTFLNLTLALQQIVQGTILIIGMTLLARLKPKR